MAILADSFLADLDDLSEHEPDYLDEDNVMVEETEAMDEAVKDRTYDDLDRVSKLQKSQRYIDTMQKVEDALQGELFQDKIDEYKLIVECNSLSLDIETEIGNLHNFICDKYRSKFPELESQVPQPMDYARVVKRIGNETDISFVDLQGLLPQSVILVVSITAASTSGKPLLEEVLEKTLDACDRMISLDSAKKKIIDFLKGKMGYIAPNLSAIVGGEIAAKLLGIAGGLSELSKVPACNVQLLGAKKNNAAGFSRVTTKFHVGYIGETDILNSTPPALKSRAIRVISAKSTLAARVDLLKGDPSGATGRALSDEIRTKIDKWQEPGPAKIVKPLPVPDSERKKKRGGRRLRKMKERYAVTEMQRLANRMQFGVPEESSLGDGIGIGYGMLGQAGSGKLRVSVVKNKFKKVKGDKKNYGTGATSGLVSSLAFTPVQGIELRNPVANQVGSGTQSTYFSETGIFSQIKKI